MVSMKSAASILTLVFMLLFIQPLFAHSGEPVKPVSCCTKGKCNKDKDQAPAGKPCDGNGCSPFMPCASGNLFTLENFIIGKLIPATKKATVAPVNDNRLLYGLSESWHPPELFHI